MHVNDILTRIGKAPDKASRVSVAGTLASYVRSGQIFTRPAPNTFGLVEWESSGPISVDEEEEEDSAGEAQMKLAS